MSMLMMVLVATQQFISHQQDTLVQEMLNEHHISAQLGGLATAARQLKLHQEGYVTHLQNPSMRAGCSVYFPAEKPIHPHG